MHDVRYIITEVLVLFMSSRSCVRSRTRAHIKLYSSTPIRIFISEISLFILVIVFFILISGAAKMFYIE